MTLEAIRPCWRCGATIRGRAWKCPACGCVAPPELIAARGRADHARTTAAEARARWPELTPEAAVRRLREVGRLLDGIEARLHPLYRRGLSWADVVAYLRGLGLAP